MDLEALFHCIMKEDIRFLQFPDRKVDFRFRFCKMGDFSFSNDATTVTSNKSRGNFCGKKNMRTCPDFQR